MGLPEGAQRACRCCLSRRRFFAAGAAAMAAAAAPVRGAAEAARRIVDVHAHFTPPAYIKAMARTGILPPPTINWSVERHLEEMDKGGVARSMLSLSAPGAATVADVRSGLVREVNEYGAQLAADRRDRLGFFVHLPLSDPDASLRELEHGLDVLKGAGVGLLTSYGGKYLGDPAFDPVFAELERRKAVVYVHPTYAACCTGVLPVISDAMIEFGTDTTRAIANYVYRGGARRYPNVKMIWSHAGGSMPYLIGRFERNQPSTEAAPDGFRAEARRFFYDVAQSANPITSAALRQLVPVTQIVFGTDYPYGAPREQVAALEGGGVFSARELDGLYRGNVERSLPALLA